MRGTRVAATVNFVVEVELRELGRSSLETAQEAA
jgi:hypothetical protein